MALSATTTNDILLGTCVTNLETRHPSVTAAAASTIEELAPKRVLLGVGSGDSSIKTLGLKPTKLDRMREQIGLIRERRTGNEVDFQGRTMHLKAANSRAADSSTSRPARSSWARRRTSRSST